MRFRRCSCCRSASEYTPARFRDVLQASLPAAFQRFQRLLSTRMRVRIFSCPTPRRGSRIRDVDQFLNGVLAIADHVGRNPLGNGHDLPVDNQNPIVLAGDVALDNGLFRPALVLGIGYRTCELRRRSLRLMQTPAAMIAVERFDYHWISDSDSPRARRLRHSAPPGSAGTGMPTSCRSFVGQFLVRRRYRPRCCWSVR